MIALGAGSAQQVQRLAVELAKARRVTAALMVRAAAHAAPDRCVRVEYGCTCGAAAAGRVTEADAEALRVAWPAAHSRSGCRPCSVVAAYELRHEGRP